MEKIFLKILFSLFFISITLGNTAIVKVQPQQPAVGEAFNLIFQIESSSNEEPFIAFDPGDIAVIGKGETGYSSRTTIINGKITTEKELTVSYTLSADKPGSKVIRDISIDVGGNKIKLRDLRLQVLSESSKSRDLFIETELSKDVVYVGEGIIVNYYLYNKLPVTTIDFDVFPKLNDFVKRFYNPTGASERVNYKGEIHTRSLRYSAKVFPTKAGELTIDPLRLRVGYMESDNYNPYSVLGIGYGKQKNKTIASQPAKVIVKELPAGVPNGFTGLVGKHNFKLLAPRSKYLVNEAIELTLEVDGQGLLENYEGPAIYEHDELENFDRKAADLKEDGQGLARKTFEYTYLARNNLSIPERKLDLYYLNPETSNYEKVSLDVPELIASGAQNVQADDTKTKSNAEAPNEITAQNNSASAGFQKRVVDPQFTRELSPIFNDQYTKNRGYKIYNLVILLGILLIFFEFVFKRYRQNQREASQLLTYLKDVKSGKTNFANIYSLLDSALVGSGSVTHRIQASSLSIESKRYFISLLDNFGKSEYKDKDKYDVKINNLHLKELVSKVGKVDESNNPYL